MIPYYIIAILIHDDSRGICISSPFSSSRVHRTSNELLQIINDGHEQAVTRTKFEFPVTSFVWNCSHLERFIYGWILLLCYVLFCIEILDPIICLKVTMSSLYCAGRYVFVCRMFSSVLLIREKHYRISRKVFIMLSGRVVFWPISFGFGS